MTGKCDACANKLRDAGAVNRGDAAVVFSVRGSENEIF